MKFAEIPQRLSPLLNPPDPIVIKHMISMEDLKQAETKKTACYDIDVEVDDTLKTQMNNFLLSTTSQQEIQSLDNKIQETVETINSLKTMTDVAGNPEEERRVDYFYQPWVGEGVSRYF